jgi:hypothetical protein
MRFYNIDYLQMQSNINDYLKYIVIFSSLFILIVVFSLYMGNPPIFNGGDK